MQPSAWPNLQVAAINDQCDRTQLEYLLRFDSVQGRVDDIDTDAFIWSNHCDLAACSEHWQQHNLDLIIESTGKYLSRSELQQHQHKVVLTAPSTTNDVPTIVYGVNEGSIQGDCISAASCTSNALAPVLNFLDNTYGLDHCHTLTLHSPMNDQPLLDTASQNTTQLALLRSGGTNLSPVATALDKGIERILPSMHNRISSHSLRVPVIDSCAMQLLVTLSNAIDSEDTLWQDLTRYASASTDIIGLSEHSLVSSDVRGNNESVWITKSDIEKISPKKVRMLLWFDNEVGFAHRVLDLANHWASNCTSNGAGH